METRTMERTHILLTRSLSNLIARLGTMLRHLSTHSYSEQETERLQKYLVSLWMMVIELEKLLSKDILGSPSSSKNAYQKMLSVDTSKDSTDDLSPATPNT